MEKLQTVNVQTDIFRLLSKTKMEIESDRDPTDRAEWIQRSVRNPTIGQ